jgi:preprotein translocase subunit SecA
MLNFFKRLVGDTNDKEVKRLEPLVKQINTLAEAYRALTDDELRFRTTRFRAQLAEGMTLDQLLPDAFATVREAAFRTIGLRHYDVQLIGGIVLHQGKIAEMKTGEGKTLVATLPLYLNALPGKGVHLVTVNDYLAKVGAGWMGPIYHFLGLTIGFIAHDQSARYDPDYIDPAANPEDKRLVHWRPCTRQEAYAADIVYGTNNEFGFDYLRNNMAYEAAQQAQAELVYAIVDEVDNILIDEARTPLIISGPAQKSSELYRQVAVLVRQLKRSSLTPKQVKDEGLTPDGDFMVEERSKSVTLTEQGIEKLERLLRIPPGQSLYDPEHYEKTHFVENALRAQFIFQRDRDYMVTPGGEVVIVDEFTGRAMPGRRWSDGLHQAVEAKEGVEIRNENVTLATITFQNFFRMYRKLAGMTGTGYTEREEFHKIYGLDVVIIPTNRANVRQDLPDQVFGSEEAKFNAVVEETAAMTELGRPVLIGTTSVETSERVSQLLRGRGIRHEVLNAKQHEREAGIVAQAGRLKAVTVATNMAGRGTDILLGGNPDGLIDDLLAEQGLTLATASAEQQRSAYEQARKLTAVEGDQVRTLGGLHIIGTERHEARRIDNQLRGRAGRQGDPGSSRFFLSLEDDLMRRFGPVDRIKGLMGRLVDPNLPLEASILDRTIEGAQTRVEGYNFDIRKHTVEFDDVMNKQRQLIYADRQAILEGADMRERVLDLLAEEVSALVDEQVTAEAAADETAADEIVRQYRRYNPLVAPAELKAALLGKAAADAEQHLLDELETVYTQREALLGADVMRTVERRVMLGAIDRQWIDYLTGMDELRQSINLQAYAQKDPLVEFKRQSFQMFDELKANIAHEIAVNLLPASLQYEEYLRRLEAEQAQRLALAQAGGGSSEQANIAEQEAKQPRRVVIKIGRNDLCPCGSGRKFKDCHLGRESELRLVAVPAAQPPQPQPKVRVQKAVNPAIAAEAAKILASQQGNDAAAEAGSAQARPQPAPRGKKR